MKIMDHSKRLNDIEKSPSAQHELAWPCVSYILLFNALLVFICSGSAILDGTKLNVDTFTDQWLQIKASYLKPLCCCQNGNALRFCIIVKNLATQLNHSAVTTPQLVSQILSLSLYACTCQVSHY